MEGLKSGRLRWRIFSGSSSSEDEDEEDCSSKTIKIFLKKWIYNKTVINLTDRRQRSKFQQNPNRLRIQNELR